MFFTFGMWSSFALFGVCSVAASLDPGLSSPWLQFGALGLCGFMIFQNARQHNSLTNILTYKDTLIGEKDKAILDLNIRMLEAFAQNKRALEQLNETLRSKL